MQGARAAARGPLRGGPRRRSRRRPGSAHRASDVRPAHLAGDAALHPAARSRSRRPAPEDRDGPRGVAPRLMRVSISLRLAQTDWAEASAYVTEAERLGVRRRLVRGGLGPRRRHPARVHGRAHLAHPPRHRHLAGGHAHAALLAMTAMSLAGHVQRPLPARPRRERAAGDRGLARHPLRPAGAAHARDRRDRPPGRSRASASSTRARSTSCRCRAARARPSAPPRRPSRGCRSTWRRSRRRASR